MKRIVLQLLIVSFLSILTSSCYEEIDLLPDIIDKDDWVFVDDSRLFLDNKNQIALLVIKEYGEFEGKLKLPYNYELKINGVKVSNGQVFDFEEINRESSFSVELVKESGAIENYNLAFTLLPIVEINHNFPEIRDDKKVFASFFLFGPKENEYYEEYCGIELRGRSSLSYPKKSYGIEFNKISGLEDEKNVSLLGMAEDDDWILDASFIDKSNMRNRVSFEFWKDIQMEAKEKGRNTLASSAEGKYIELFINSEYLGLYCLSEKIDGKRLGLTDIENQSFLYKSEHWSPATAFTGLPDTLNLVTDWANWVQKIPDPMELSIWKPLYSFVEFVITSGDEVFKDSIANYLEIDQAIDYFILVNLIMGNDNVIKNVFLTKTSINSPFFMSPWDMDASWGRDWQGSEDAIDVIVTFKLFDRLMALNPDAFKAKVADRWEDLRSNVLANDHIIEKFDFHFQEMISSGAARREFQKWPESLPDFEYERIYLNSWTTNRLLVLDSYFDSL